MAEQQSRKESLDKFTPCSGDESYLKKPLVKEGGQWEEVRQMWTNSKLHAAKAVSLFMDLGDILLVLREGKTDPAFGKLRKKYVPELSRQDASRAMAMAKNRDRFEVPELADAPSISVFAEMVNASDELVEQILDQTADKEKKSPTVKEVRESVAEEQAPQSAEDFEQSIQDDEPISKKQKAVPAENLEGDMQKILVMPLTERIEHLRSGELDTFNALLLIGVNPNYEGDYPCSPDVWALITDNIYEGDLSQDHADIVEYCVEMIDDSLWGEWDE